MAVVEAGSVQKRPSVKIPQEVADRAIELRRAGTIPSRTRSTTSRPEGAAAPVLGAPRGSAPMSEPGAAFGGAAGERAS